MEREFQSFSQLARDIYSIFDAVTEIIDNPYSESSIVDIKIDNTLVAMDDFHGFTPENLSRVFHERMCHIPQSKNDIGMFGLGLKGALLALTKKEGISTCKIITSTDTKSYSILTYKFDSSINFEEVSEVQTYKFQNSDKRFKGTKIYLDNLIEISENTLRSIKLLLGVRYSNPEHRKVSSLYFNGEKINQIDMLYTHLIPKECFSKIDEVQMFIDPITKIFFRIQIKKYYNVNDLEDIITVPLINIYIPQDVYGKLDNPYDRDNKKRDTNFTDDVSFLKEYNNIYEGAFISYNNRYIECGQNTERLFNKKPKAGGYCRSRLGILLNSNNVKAFELSPSKNSGVKSIVSTQKVPSQYYVAFLDGKTLQEDILNANTFVPKIYRIYIDAKKIFNKEESELTIDELFPKSKSKKRKKKSTNNVNICNEAPVSFSNDEVKSIVESLPYHASSQNKLYYTLINYWLKVGVSLDIVQGTLHILNDENTNDIKVDIHSFIQDLVAAK